VACITNEGDHDNAAANNEDRDEANIILPEIELCHCEDCSEMLDTDVKVPTILLGLHKILAHSKAQDKSGKKRKAA